MYAIGNDLVQGDRTFVVNLRNADQDVSIGSPGSVTITINDNDVAPPTSTPTPTPGGNIYLSGVLVLLIVVTHRQNISRLLSGTENRFSLSSKKKEGAANV